MEVFSASTELMSTRSNFPYNDIDFTYQEALLANVVS